MLVNNADAKKLVAGWALAEVITHGVLPDAMAEDMTTDLVRGDVATIKTPTLDALSI